MLKKDLRNEKGSITLFVLLAMLFFLIVIFGMFMTSSNKNSIQVSELDKIKKEYGESVNNIDQIYAEVLETEPKMVDGVIIPDGFYYVGGRKDSGIVISDNPYDEEIYKNKEKVGNDLQGNQFVWIPVEDFSEFTREHFGTDLQKWWAGTFVTDELSTNNLYEPVSDGNKDTTEVDKIYKSVEDYKGFYVGRYEAGTTESSGTGIRGNIVCKQGMNAYNEIGFAATDDIIDEKGGAVEAARGMYSKQNGDSVTSTLIYGVQWDAIMRWMKSEPNLSGGKYVQDSMDMGWYNYSNSNPMTGIDFNGGKNVVKNIYDLAGNVSEWTMESYYGNGSIYRISRGGGIYDYGADSPASSRNFYDRPSLGDLSVGFRVTLYL